MSLLRTSMWRKVTDLMRYNVLVQAAMTEAERQAQEYEDALGKARTIEQHLQQRLRQVDEQLQVEYSTTLADNCFQSAKNIPQHAQQLLHCAVRHGRTGHRRGDSLGCFQVTPA